MADEKVEDLTSDELAAYEKAKTRVPDIITKLNDSDLNCVDQRTLINELHFRILWPMFFNSKMSSLFVQVIVDNQFFTLVEEKLGKKMRDSEIWSNNVVSLLQLLRNILYWSCEKTGAVFLERNMHAVLVNTLSDKNLMSLESKEAGGLVFELLCCCYNAMKISPDSRLEFRKRGLVQLCKHYMQKAGGDRTLTNELLFVLSYVADLDADPEALKATNTNLDYIHERVKVALKEENHRSEIGFSAAEILACISRLVLSSDNALFLIDRGLIDTCESIMEAEFSDEEVQLALEILWSLSFQPNCATEIKAKDTLYKMIKSYKYSSNKHLRENADWILFQLNNNNEESENVTKKVTDQISEDCPAQDTDQHIMISYSWRQAEVI